MDDLVQFDVYKSDAIAAPAFDEAIANEVLSADSGSLSRWWFKQSTAKDHGIETFPDMKGKFRLKVAAFDCDPTDTCSRFVDVSLLWQNVIVSGIAVTPRGASKEANGDVDASAFWLGRAGVAHLDKVRQHPSSSPSTAQVSGVRQTQLSKCLDDGEIDSLMVALLVSMDSSSGLAQLTGWFAAVPGSAPALPTAIDESYGSLQQDFAMFRKAPVKPSPRLEAFWQALTLAVNETDHGVYELRKGLPWRVGDRPPDSTTVWNGAALWRKAAAELTKACSPK
jgi:hypothetical protein